MQEFTIFDIIILSMTILLGLKGLMKGFVKEVFGLIGIIGGIFIASRLAKDIGDIVAPILALENDTMIKLIGFIVALIGFWTILYIIGIIISNIFSASGLGLFDRILGFLFGSAKIFFILSVLVYAIYQIETVRNLMKQKIPNSITLPLLLDTGGFIIKLDPVELTKKIEENINITNEQKTSISEQTKQTLEKLKATTNETIENTKEVINQEVEKATQETTQNIMNSISNEKTIEPTIDNKEKGN